MSLPAMMAAMMNPSAGGLPPLGDLIQLPCAVCLATSPAPPERAVTVAAGSLVCAAHVSRVLQLEAPEEERPREELPCTMFDGNYHHAHGWSHGATAYHCPGSSPAVQR